MSRVTAEIVCRALLAIVAALRKEYDLPEYHHVTIHMEDTLAGFTDCSIIPKTE
jgi:hypothetical protein